MALSFGHSNVSDPRLSFAELRIVCDYLCAVRNEIAIDLHAIKLGGLDPARYGKFPRPSRWIRYFKNFPFISRLLHGISLPVWYLLGPWLFRFQYKLLRVHWRAAGQFQFDEGGQVLAFSTRSVDLVRPHNIHPTPRQWLEFPWLPLSNLPADANVLPALALLNELEIERSLTLAILAHRSLQKRQGMSEWGLQSFTAWRWFFARLAVDKLPGPLLSVEHFDRWAVLVDRSVCRPSGHWPKRHHIIMQHGSVNAEKAPQRLGICLPTRLSAVSHLHVYSPADAAVFKADILSPSCANSRLHISFYRPCIMLSDMSTTDGPPSILFVGHPFCENAHCALLSALCKKGNWQLFYKPHPANPASKHIRDLPWTVVEGRSVFPRVDLLISYPSTMVSEYATHGIQAVVHSINVSAEQLLDRLPEVFQLIKESHSSTASSLLREPSGPFL